MKQRFVMIFAVMIMLVLGTVLPAAAQDGENPICAGLAAEDCQTLTGVSTAMADVTSFAIPAWSFDITLDTGAPEQSVTLNASGTGQVMLPADAATSTDDLLVHFTLDNFSATGEGQTQTGAGELIVQGNMIYVSVNGEWFGGELTAEDQQSLQDSLGGMTGGDMGMSDLSSTDMGDMTGLFNTVASQEDVDGQAATRFATTVDLNVLLPALTDPSATEGMGETGQQVQMMLTMFSSMLTGTTITFEQVVGQDDGFLHNLALNVDLPAAAEGAAVAISGGLHFNADFAQYNEAFTVTPPESFRPLEELESQMNTGM